MDRGNFARAAENLIKRYYRRFKSKGVDRFKWDQTSVKDRWYKRQTCQYVRERLGRRRQ
jgi:hypothetical protein